MTSTFTIIMDLTGTFSFAVAGAVAAREKGLDYFGVLILAFVTAIGGGTVRDLLLGATPVAWLSDMRSIWTIGAGYLVAMTFPTRIRRWQRLLTIFDALGLGFFTLLGVQKAERFGLPPGVCIALGTVTGCFGGVIRDVLLNNLPLVFHREIYASASIAGGILLYLLQPWAGNETAYMAALTLIVGIRLLAVRYGWSLPAGKRPEGPSKPDQNQE